MSRQKDKENSQATQEHTEAEEQFVRELVLRTRDGDQKAFAQLVALYRQPVASVAYRMVNDFDEAADITQAVFIKMAKNIWRFDPSKKFYTWLYRIAINASIDHMRKHKRHKHEPLENVQETVKSTLSGPEHDFRRRQIAEYIERATHNLNDKQRSAFILRDLEGCKIDDVAQIMDMPEATVRWYLHRARSMIRRELSRKCPQLLALLGVR
ncbi:MAG: sigma-70 family RNA polymerase sigma factor [bacterium]|nr:sigma-70 family RNA polymerase sigma factor [bacterium]